MQNLIKKSDFATLAGVNPSTLTRITKTVLKAAVVGKLIDVDHPDAVAYLAKRERDTTPPVATGIDTRYEEAVTVCQTAGKYSATHVQKALGVGFDRAKKIVATMRASGVIPEPGAAKVTLTSEDEPPIQMDRAAAERLGLIQPDKITKPRGQAVVRDQKKSAPAPESTGEVFEVPDDIGQFADYTIRQIIERFGRYPHRNAILNRESTPEELAFLQEPGSSF